MLRWTFALSTLALSLGLATATAAAPGWQLDPERGLQWQDAQGRTNATVPVRTKRWDARRLPDGRELALALDPQRGELLLAEGRGAQARVLARHPAPGFEVERLCLHRDPQGLLHAFLLGKQGHSEQWLLDDAQSRVVRPLATPLEPADCAVRDAEQRLYVTEPGVGLWALATDAERPARQLLVWLPEADDKALRQALNRWLAEHPEAPAPTLPVVLPHAQTAPVQQHGDAADDPAVWVHPRRTADSRIVTTDKKRGLRVYDLAGRQRQFLPVGRLNNVDLRQNLRDGARRIDLVVATQRDENSLVLWQVQANGQLRELARLPTDLQDIYGLCVGRNELGGLDAFPNDKDGRVQQWRIARRGGVWQASKLREHRLTSQPEGCVVDEATQTLFVGEEKHGVWRFDLGAGTWSPTLIVTAGGALVADVEGLAIYPGTPTHPSRYLAISSQGNDSFLVVDAAPPHTLRGAFRVGLNPARGVDAVSETDGIDISAVNFGGPYGEGMLVVQDGHKRLPAGPQNFKLVPWSAVRQALRLP